MSAESTDIVEYKRRRRIALRCYLHDPSIPDEDKVQTLCHCWDHLDANDNDEGSGRGDAA